MRGKKGEWQEVKLGDIVNFVSKKIDSSSLTMQNYISTDNMLVDRGGITEASNIPKIPKFNHYQPSDTLLSNIRTYFRKVWIADREGGASPDVLILRPIDTKELCSQYLFYIISSQEFIDYTNLTSKGAKMPRGDKEAMQRYLLHLPSPAEQKAIADVLSILDKKIELNRKMNETLEEIAKALFKSWFVDFDPVRAKMAGKKPEGLSDDIAALFPDTFINSPLSEIPEGWEVKALDEVADFLNGIALQKYPATNDNYLPVIKISELRQGITKNTDKASPEIPERYIIDDGDVLFSWSGSLTQVLWTSGRGALNQHLFKVTSDYPKWFHYHWVEHHLPWFQKIAASKATTMGHIQRIHLKQAKIVLPNPAIMEAANAVLQPILDKRLTCGLENKKLVSIRDALLPKLISGELLVSDAA